MKKQAAPPKETKELPQMTQEDFLERFYDGKISYKLPSKYPENFSLCTSYNDGKKDIPLTNRDKVGAILKDAYNAVKPIVKKFKLSLALLVESNVTYKGVAWTKRIKIDFSMPGLGGKREELIAYTSMIQIKIRNKEFPQNPKKFLNRTTILAILLHELAHTRHMHHKIEFALFLKEMFEHAMTLGIFPPGEEHMLPSSRAWERRMFETKGSMTREELDTFFEGEAANADHSDGEHGHEWEHGEAKGKEEVKSEHVPKEPSKPIGGSKEGKSGPVINNKITKKVEPEVGKKVRVTKGAAVKPTTGPKTSSRASAETVKTSKSVVLNREVTGQIVETKIMQSSVMEIENESAEIKEVLRVQIEENKTNNDGASRAMEIEKAQ